MIKLNFFKMLLFCLSIIFVAGHLVSGQHTQEGKFKDAILAIGGMGNEGVELYDVANNSWSRVSSIPHSRIQHSGHQLSAGTLPVNGTSSESMVYVCAGDQMESRCFRYDPKLDTWYGGVGHTKKSRLSSAMLQSPDGRFLYKVGGMGADMKHPEDEKENASLPIERYDPVQNYWTVLTTIPQSEGKSSQLLITINYVTFISIQRKRDGN